MKEKFTLNDLHENVEMAMKYASKKNEYFTKAARVRVEVPDPSGKLDFINYPISSFYIQDEWNEVVLVVKPQ